MPSHDLTLFADYFQFYLQDASAEADLAAAWDDVAVERMLAVASGAVGIGTARNMAVAVTLEFLGAAPAEDFADVDHVAEGSLQLATGPLVVAGCTEYLPDAARFDMAAGTYRVRLSVSRLHTVSDDGLEGQDHYRVQLWPAPPIAPRVLKQGAV